MSAVAGPSDPGSAAARRAPDAFPNSGGLAVPRMGPQAGACDCHIHLYDARSARVVAPQAMVAHATAADYRKLQARIGTSRTVIVQPRAHGTDNGTVLAGIAELGQTRARGVAVVDATVSDAELRRLDAGGVRGIRFSFYSAANSVTGIEMVEPLARRVADLGWHVQLHWNASQFVEYQTVLRRLPVTLVVDHMGRALLRDGTIHPAFEVVRRLVDGGHTWVKLSGAYLDSSSGARGDWRDTDALARRWLSMAPERLVWGSDWPHPTEPEVKPDDAALLDLLARWAPDAGVRRRILVENPEALYGFAPQTARS